MTSTKHGLPLESGVSFETKNAFVDIVAPVTNELLHEKAPLVRINADKNIKIQGVQVILPGGSNGFYSIDYCKAFHFADDNPNWYFYEKESDND